MRHFYAFLALFVLAFSAFTHTHAQERFFTNSDTRGLQNAKTEARLSKHDTDIEVLEGDVGQLNQRMSNVETSCNQGEKLRWDGAAWICSQEVDPTVQEFAKEALPSCNTGEVLTASIDGKFECVADNEGIADEVDPTVQDFAKSPVPNCGAGQVLTGDGAGLTCVSDGVGGFIESDPLTQPFAKSVLPSCGAGEVLRANGSSLSCIADAGGS